MFTLELSILRKSHQERRKKNRKAIRFPQIWDDYLIKQEGLRLSLEKIC
jgi:hypothetical protein